MSHHKDWSITREALATAAGPAGPTRERYRSALAHYVSVVAGVPPRRPRTPPPTTSAEPWELSDLTVSDVMTAPAISVSGDTRISEIIDVLAEYKISTVPVADDRGAVIGVVSASDLLARVVDSAAAPDIGSRDRSHADTAVALMTAPAVTIAAGSSVAEAARVAARAHTTLLPVINEGGSLVGVVSRSDLVRVFLHGDDVIRKHIVSDVIALLRIDPNAVQVVVHDGVVTLSGQVEPRAVIGLLGDAVRGISGVVAVDNRLSVPAAPRH